MLICIYIEKFGLPSVSKLEIWVLKHGRKLHFSSNYEIRKIPTNQPFELKFMLHLELSEVFSNKKSQLKQEIPCWFFWVSKIISTKSAFFQWCLQFFQWKPHKKRAVQYFLNRLLPKCIRHLSLSYLLKSAKSRNIYWAHSFVTYVKWLIKK